MIAVTLRVRLDITGVVQGLGFRPAVARIAAEYGLGGGAYNDAGAVHCEFEGPAPDVDTAVSALQHRPPPMARIDTLAVTAVQNRGDARFEIIESQTVDTSRTLVPPDISTCADCLREMRDSADRRFGRPFITCTNCGPRYTVITDLPYDRPTLTMADFPMCAACSGEYDDPIDRRFHAQTIACADCGPRLSGSIEAVADALLAKKVVAIKGIGGYHLACRADDTAAVTTLRDRKNRPAKPYAVMVADLDAARLIADVDDAAAVVLTNSAAPIVLVSRRGTAVSDAVAPGLADLGVMLAYSPVHHLLFDRLGAIPLVMTSANQGGSPIVYREQDLDWISGLADAVLSHDRPIHVPCEDSVITIDDQSLQLPLRRSRGYAPLPVSVAVSGAEATTTWARRVADGRPVLAVQHHHAHAVSLLAEHQRLDTPIIAVAYDGTGYGLDSTVWGGELLAISDPAQFTRAGHLTPFALPGGDGAVREPARIALDLLTRAGIDWTPDLPPVAAVGEAGLHVLGQQIPRGLGCVPTTSMGRLFDTVASLLGVCQQVSYESQAAVELEQLARRGRDARLDFAVDGAVMDPAPVILGIVDGMRAGVELADLAAGFHQAVIRATATAVWHCADAAGISVIGLTGGVFANGILLQGLRESLTNTGFEVLSHRIVGGNDGGLALGQATIAAALRFSRAAEERNGACASESPAR